MKKYNLVFLVTVAIAIATAAHAQGTVKSLVNAEKAFAAYTETHSIRDGFLKYLDSEGLIFSRGQALNAHAQFSKQPAGPAVLSWYPTYAIVSAAGDLGVTTGPFVLRATSLADTPVGRGQFSSVWKMNKAGEWKNIIDLGVAYRKKTSDPQLVNEIALVQKDLPSALFTSIIELDKRFNLAIKEKNAGEFLSQLSADSWLNAEGETPLLGAQLIGNLMMHMPDTVLFTPIAGAVSASNDLAYVYGSVINGSKKENYLRVWANRNRKWQVVLQTIKW